MQIPEDDLRCVAHVLKKWNCTKILCEKRPIHFVGQRKHREQQLREGKLLNAFHDCPFKQFCDSTDYKNEMRSQEYKRELLKQFVSKWIELHGVTQADLLPYLLG